jgi:hypothetical protein
MPERAARCVPDKGPAPRRPRRLHVLGILHFPGRPDRGGVRAAPGGEERGFCVWSRDFGSRFLPTSPFTEASGRHSSFDAWVCTGYSEIFTGPGGALIWDPVHGSRDLKALLLSLGVGGIGSYSLGGPMSSWDGRTVVGNLGPVPGPGGGMYIATIPGFCYANCNGSTVAPVLNVADFVCYLNKFSAGDPYANCDGSWATPVLNISDFICYLNRFAAGCP